MLMAHLERRTLIKYLDISRFFIINGQEEVDVIKFSILFF